jgi:hypothetical protein
LITEDSYAAQPYLIFGYIILFYDESLLHLNFAVSVFHGHPTNSIGANP